MSKHKHKRPTPIVRPEVGDVAVCSAGFLGYVTNITVTYDHVAQRHRKLWRGLQIDPEHAGYAWESVAPAKVISLVEFDDDHS